MPDSSMPKPDDEPTELGEALAVLASVDGSLYPSTNPAVLLKAARVIYLNQEHLANPQGAIQRILIWTMSVIVQNSPDSLPNMSKAHLEAMSFERGR